MELSALQNLLLHSLRVDTLPVAADFELLDTTDWSTLQQQAHAMGVAPLLYHQLHRAGVLTTAPPSVQQSLHGIYLNTAAHTHHLYRRLEEITTAFTAESIPVIALKGAYLAEAIYGNLALRPLGDLDLMVPKADAQRAADILVKLGFLSPSRALMEKSLAHGKHLPTFFHADRRCIVEIHWHVTTPDAPYGIAIDELWARSQSLLLAGSAVRVLSPEDVLLHLCMHLSYEHQFSFGLRPYIDLAWFSGKKGSDLDWNVVVARARAWRWSRGVGLALRLTREWLGAPVPDHVWQALCMRDGDALLCTHIREQTFTSMLSDRDRVPLSVVPLYVRQPFRHRMLALGAILDNQVCLLKNANLDPQTPANRWRYVRILFGKSRQAISLLLRLLRRDSRTKQVIHRRTMVMQGLQED